MSTNYTLKYRQFDQLVADCSSDFEKYQLMNKIDPQDLIKVARRITYDLGLRIYKKKEVVLEIERGRVRFPNDFYVLNFALVLGKYSVKQYLPQGTHTEQKIIGTLAQEYQQAPPETINLCSDAVILEEPEIENPCCDNSCELNCKGEVVQLVQKLHYQTRYYEEIFPLRIKENNEKLNNLCPNLYWDSPLTGTVKDGWLHVSFSNGSVYVNYMGDLEDEEGNLLVPDHPLLNEYYEYGCKQRILENLLLNGEDIKPNVISLIEQRYKTARIAALSLVNTPNFKEIKELHQANRNAMYSKYYDMFARVPRVNIR